MWFALNNDKPEFEYSYNYQNWYPSVEYETKNTRKNVGLFDLTAFLNIILKEKKFIASYKKFAPQILKTK